MNDGFWVNYDTGKAFPIGEHETWLREAGNAKKLGLRPSLIAMFGNFKPVKDRDKFLLFVMNNAPVMRVRGHGAFVTFEYASSDKQGPMDAIWSWCRRNGAGPMTNLQIVNFKDGQRNVVPFSDFEEAMRGGGYNEVMRVASSNNFRIRKMFARELLRLAKEVIS